MPLRRCLIIIWLCFLVRGLFYCTVWPLWEGVDEWAHFAVAENMSKEGPIIDRNSPTSDQINVSLKLAALPRGLTLMPSQSLTREQYWEAPVEERTRREAALQVLDSEEAAGYSLDRMPAFEASQPPLYYWLIAIVLRLMGSATLVSQVWFARVVTFAIASLAIPLGFILAREVFKRDSIALGLAALIALMPGLAINLDRVSNEALGITVFTGLLLVVCRWMEDPHPFSRSLAVGVVLGIGLLTKAYFLTAVPAVVFLYLLRIWQQRRNAGKAREHFLHGAIAIAVALGIGGWWYLRNVLQTGTVSGLDEALMLRTIGIAEKSAAVLRVDWHAAIDTILLSHIWYAGGSGFALRRSIYRMFYYFLFVASCGLIFSRQFLRNSMLLSISVLYGFFWLGLGCQIVMLFLSKSTSTAMGGWYLHSMIWAEVILFIAGFFAIVPTRFQNYVLVIFIVAMAGLDIYSLHFVALPYYAHTENLLSPDVFRLLIGKPQFLGPSALISLWALFFLSIGVTVYAGFQQSVRKSEGLEPGRAM